MDCIHDGQNHAAFILCYYATQLYAIKHMHKDDIVMFLWFRCLCNMASRAKDLVLSAF